MIGEEMPLKQDNGKSWRGRRKTSPQRLRENKKLKTSLAADRCGSVVGVVLRQKEKKNQETFLCLCVGACPERSRRVVN
jgi:hypothetical protein